MGIVLFRARKLPLHSHYVPFQIHVNFPECQCLSEHYTGPVKKQQQRPETQRVNYPAFGTAYDRLVDETANFHSGIDVWTNLERS